MKYVMGLLIVDLQNDFLPGGKLGVPEGDSIIPVINKYIKLFSSKDFPIFASRDWHPENTRHFNKFGGIWPVHCLQNTKGAQFHSALRLPKEAILLFKGMDQKEDSYSAFQAVDSDGNEFSLLLKLFGVRKLFVAGLATDYCVKWSVIDAIKRGYLTYFLLDAIQGVNLKPEDSKNAIITMKKKGAKAVTFSSVKKVLT